MSLVRDAIYILLALLSAPIWIIRLARTGKYRTDWRQRFGLGPPVGIPAGRSRPRIVLHAVSVGEVNAARQLVTELVDSPDQPVVIIATTTDTGYARASELFAARHHVVRYPFDISFAVGRFLDRTRPDVVVLMELEVWPNFVAACRRRAIPVVVINGRLSERSFRRYRLVMPLVKPMFRSLHIAAVQTEQYAARFRALGMPHERVVVTDTMKWDTAEIPDAVDGAEELAQRMGIDRTRRLIVAGSTAPGEHELLARVVPPEAQLLCAPRKPEWFDEAANALGECVRWSQCNGEGHECRRSRAGRFLLDTIGELRRAYALADLVVVGRTFVPLGGSDMIEPVALGKATIVGPHVENFQFAANVLLAGEGLVQVDARELEPTIKALLDDDAHREMLGSNGRSVIQQHQGATQRHAGIIRDVLAKTL
jgi:3-deoxy-D-manno-octulosonic-acid transferase